MATNTFQGRMRTTAGNPRSVIDPRSGLPGRVLTQNLAGPIQLVLPLSPANGAYEIGFVPARFVIESCRVIVPAGAGTFRVDLPAFDGNTAIPVAAALSDATDPAADVIVTPFTIPLVSRPVSVTTAGGVTGALVIGLFGFPLDDAAEENPTLG